MGQFEFVKKQVKKIRWAQHESLWKECLALVALISLQAGSWGLLVFSLLQFRKVAKWKDLRLPFLLYLFWAWVLDRNVSKKGGRPWEWWRKLDIWKAYKNYFPSSIQLDFSKDEWSNFRYGPDGQERAFVFGLHPHGIISHSFVSNFMALSDELENVNYRIGTVGFNVFMPFWRELIFWSGVIHADTEALDSCLRQGISVALVIGGAEEALDARPGTVDLKLATRKGFVKLALRNGAGLVPVFSFGENDLYKQLIPNPPGSTVRNIQTYLKDLFGYSLPLFYGRWGTPVVPFRHPLVSVIGRPIDMPKIEHPTQHHIDFWHDKYVEKLNDLYERYKTRYDMVLRIVDAEKKEEEEAAKFSKM